MALPWRRPLLDKYRRYIMFLSWLKLARKPKRVQRRRSFRPVCDQLESRLVPTVIADFNGDGFSDLAIGVPGENNSAGAVNVIYGSAAGLSANGPVVNQLWSQDSAAVADTSEALDQFG